MKKYLALVFLIILFSCRKEKVINPAQPKNPYYDKAWLYLEQNDPTKAFINFSKVVSFSTDSLLIAKSFTHMAVIQGNQGDYFGSEESAAKAILYFKPNSEYLPGVFNSIGIAKYNLKDFSEASNWYQRAITTAKDSLNGLIYQNNLAVSLVEQKKYDEAVSLLYNILQSKLIKKDMAMFAQAYDNLTWAKWLQNPKYDAVPDYHHALNIRLKEQNLWGQNASYAHLADFYINNNIDSALQYSEKMYATAKAISSPDDQIEALKKLIQLSNADKSKAYFTRFTKLEDSIQTARNAAKNQFALIRYESEKHKADNLKLQQDNTQKKYEIVKRDLIIYLIIVLTIAGIIVAYTIFKKRKQKIELEAKKSIQESRLKTSKKVHDVVANGLYRVITEIENQDSIEKEEILDRLDIMYQKSRDISYEVEEIIPETEQLNQTFTKLFDSFKTQETNITVKGNTDDLWQNTNPTIRLELEHILQELMVNMSKHSQATQVDISFEQEENNLKINYLDNGIGIKKPIKFNNGLTNTGNRIDFINGKITFDTNVERGLHIIITVPIS